MINVEEQRAAFEKRMEEIAKEIKMNVDFDRDHKNPELYKDEDVQCAWSGWAACACGDYLIKLHYKLSR